MHQLEPVSTPAASPQSRKQRRLRTRIQRILLITLAVLLILCGTLGGIGLWLGRRVLPQTTGTLVVAGLEQKVQVDRDQWGVPAITGSSLHDLVFAQGYVTAQDRLFEMEFNRRIARGRLAEMFGRGPKDEILHFDMFIHTLNLYGAAQANLSKLDARTRIELQAYVDGVNAFLKTHQGDLPLEFSILNIKPDPWTLADCLAYGGVLELALDYSWYYKYTRALILAKAGPAVTAALFPPYPTTNPTLIGPSGQAEALSSSITSTPAAMPSLSPSLSASFARLSPDVLDNAAVIQTLLGNVSDGLGSNNWVIDGTKTTTGMPLLANDPHLGIKMPSIWYEVALHSPGFDAIGFSFPGLPGIVIGHNDAIAWGLTNVGTDDADLYLEKLDLVRHPGEYLYNGQWLSLQTRKETIHIRGESQPYTFTVTSTVHGPLLNSVVDDLNHSAPVALKWAALQPQADFSGFFQLDFATNWQEFNAAINHISVGQNFIYADIRGNIGYRMSGLLPLRSADNDNLPVDGSTSAHEWHGYVPQTEMPSLYNPPTHIIVTANNQIVPASYPVYVTSLWDQGYRARRITDLLLPQPQLSIADYEKIQADVFSVPAAQLTPFFVAAAAGKRGDVGLAGKLLQNWDFTMSSEGSAAAVFETTVGNLLRNLLEPLLGKTVYNIYAANIIESNLFLVLITLLNHPQSPFFTGASGSDLQLARDSAIDRAIQSAVSQLRVQLGNDPAQWQWGQLHQAHFDHPLAGVFPFNYLFGVAPVNRAGDSATINTGGNGGFLADPPDYSQQVVSSMREIIDLGDLDNSLWVITTGESGQPFSAHYSDLIALWNQNQYQPMTFSRQAENRAARDELLLEPGS